MIDCYIVKKAKKSLYKAKSLINPADIWHPSEDVSSAGTLNLL